MAERGKGSEKQIRQNQTELEKRKQKKKIEEQWEQLNNYVNMVKTMQNAALKSDIIAEQINIFDGTVVKKRKNKMIKKMEAVDADKNPDDIKYGSIDFYQLLDLDIMLLTNILDRYSLIPKDTEAKIKSCYIDDIVEIRRKSVELDHADKYHKYLMKIIQQLQYLIGYARAVQNNSAQDSRQQREIYLLQPLRILQNEEQPVEQISRCPDEREVRVGLNKRNLGELVSIKEGREEKLKHQKNSRKNMVIAREIVCDPLFCETMEEIRQVRDVTQTDPEIEGKWAAQIEKVFRDKGWSLLYLFSPELAGREELKDDVFQQGNAIAVDIPAVFEKYDGNYVCLAGCIGTYV